MGWLYCSHELYKVERPKVDRRIRVLCTLNTRPTLRRVTGHQLKRLRHDCHTSVPDFRQTATCGLSSPHRKDIIQRVAGSLLVGGHHAVNARHHPVPVFTGSGFTTSCVGTSFIRSQQEACEELVAWCRSAPACRVPGANDVITSSMSPCPLYGSLLSSVRGWLKERLCWFRGLYSVCVWACRRGCRYFSSFYLILS